MSEPSKKPDHPALSHVGPSGEARMVDVSGKATSLREARAAAVVTIREDVLDALLFGRLPKGDAVAVARVAAIQAAKRTSELIPLCHPVTLDWINVEISRTSQKELTIRVTTRTAARTGVEMEALTGAAAAALTLYDMAKSADKSIVIGPISLEQKTKTDVPSAREV
jgi:cyclic pyranopterin phosphate synthase